MATYVPPKKNDANGFILYVSLVSQADLKVMQANPTLATGDVKIALDDGAPANLGTLPTVDADFTKRVKVTLSQAETNADNLTLVFSDAAGAEWCDLTINLQTVARQIDDLTFPATSGRSLLVEADGMAHADVKEWLAAAPAALTANGYLQAALLRWLTDNAAGTPNALATNRVDASVGAVAANAITAAAIADGAIDRATLAADTGLQSSRSNTAQAGGATSITLDAVASATADFYAGMLVYLTGGTGAGQVRLCTAYNGGTKIATVTPAWATNPDATSTFAVAPAGPVTVEAWLRAAPNALASGRVDAIANALGGGVIAAASFAAGAIDAAAIAADAIGASEFAQAAADKVWSAAARVLTAATNITSTGGTTVPQTGDNFARLGAPAGLSVSADVASVKTDTGTTIPGRLPAALVGGRMDASVGAVATGVIAAASFAAGAINAAAIAADAITDTKIATGAVTAAKFAANALATAAVNADFFDKIFNRSRSLFGETEKDSLAGAIATLLDWSISGTVRTIKKADGTAFFTQTLTSTAGANPVTAVAVD